jgi:hypothetical protein
VGAHGKGATKRVKMLGRARATPPATGRDVVGSGVGSDGYDYLSEQTKPHRLYKEACGDKTKRKTTTRRQKPSRESDEQGRIRQQQRRNSSAGGITRNAKACRYELHFTESNSLHELLEHSSRTMVSGKNACVGDS